MTVFPRKKSSSSFEDTPQKDTKHSIKSFFFFHITVHLYVSPHQKHGTHVDFITLKLQMSLSMTFYAICSHVYYVMEFD